MDCSVAGDLGLQQVLELITCFSNMAIMRTQHAVRIVAAAAPHSDLVDLLKRSTFVLCAKRLREGSLRVSSNQLEE